jgi:adenylate cyclase
MTSLRQTGWYLSAFRRIGVGRGRPLSLAVVLASVTGLLVAISVLLVLSIGWLTAAWNTNELLHAKVDLMLTAVEDRLRSELLLARAQIDGISHILEAGALDQQDRRGIQTLLMGAAAATPQLTRLVMIAPDSRMIGARRPEDAEQAGHAEQSEDVLVPIDGTAGTSLKIQYGAALAGGDGSFWTGPTYLGNRLQSGLVLRQRITQHDGRPSVLVAELTIRELSEYVRSLDNQTYGTHAFILYGADRVLAGATMTERIAGLSAQHPLPARDEVGDAVLAAPWSPYKSPFATARDIDVRIASVAGRDWIVLLRRIDNPNLPDLTVGLYMPLTGIDEEVTRLHWSVAAAALVLVCSLAAAVFLSRVIARPIRQIADCAAAVSRFELEEIHLLPRSAIRELDEQGHAFNAMLASLRWFATYVPNSLVRRLITRGDPSGIASVERIATVMFTDIAGFTAQAEQLTAPETAAFLNAHFSLVASCIEVENGTVDKYIGDAVMAFWNAPEEQIDHADRAGRAALAVRSAIAMANEYRSAKGEKPIRLRIGIHTGLVVVGNIGATGRLNYTLVGDTVNVAQRLEALGKTLDPGSSDVVIQASSATIEAMTAPFRTHFVGRFRIRGRGQLVDVHQLD